MKCFKRLKVGIDTKPFLDEIASIENAWYLHTGRQETAVAQREALAIPIRGMRKSKANGREPRDVHECRWTTTSKQFPVVREFIQSIADETESIKGRARLVCLPAGHRVHPHIDQGMYYIPRNRYHLILQSPIGSWLKTEEEEVRMQEGEFWWFDNNRIHEAYNDSDTDRIHLIFDLLPKHMKKEVYGY